MWLNDVPIVYDCVLHINECGKHAMYFRIGSLSLMNELGFNVHMGTLEGGLGSFSWFPHFVLLSNLVLHLNKSWHFILLVPLYLQQCQNKYLALLKKITNITYTSFAHALGLKILLMEAHVWDVDKFLMYLLIVA